MILENLTLSDKINVSLQVGDMVYYSPTQSAGTNSDFKTVSNYGTIVKFGVVTDLFLNGNFTLQQQYGIPNIPVNTIVVAYDETQVSPPALNDYIMFAKNKEVNSSSLIGYYAEVEFKNWSTSPVELFSISSEVSESSK